MTSIPVRPTAARSAITSSGISQPRAAPRGCASTVTPPALRTRRMAFAGSRAYLDTCARPAGPIHSGVNASSMLDTVPVEKTLHCDTFRYSNVSFTPGDFIGMNEELAVGTKEIFDWFARRGIDIGAESPYEGFYGTLSYFLWLAADKDPFHAIMMHGKAYGAGEPVEPVLGWQIHPPMQMHASDGRGAYSISATTDSYYLGALLQSYLQRKELRYLGMEGSDYVARFDDGCVSRRTQDGSKDVKYDSLIVKEGDVIIARGRDDRFIPLTDAEIRLYSVSGGERNWTLPPGWAGAQVTLSELSSVEAHEVKEFRIENNHLILTMQPRRPYVLRKR